MASPIEDCVVQSVKARVLQTIVVRLPCAGFVENKMPGDGTVLFPGRCQERAEALQHQHTAVHDTIESLCQRKHQVDRQLEPLLLMIPGRDRVAVSDDWIAEHPMPAGGIRLILIPTDIGIIEGELSDEGDVVPVITHLLQVHAANLDLVTGPRRSACDGQPNHDLGGLGKKHEVARGVDSGVVAVEIDCQSDIARNVLQGVLGWMDSSLNRSKDECAMLRPSLEYVRFTGTGKSIIS